MNELVAEWVMRVAEWVGEWVSEWVREWMNERIVGNPPTPTLKKYILLTF